MCASFAFLKRDRKKGHGIREVGRALEELGEGKCVIQIYCLKTIFFNKKFDVLYIYII